MELSNNLELQQKAHLIIPAGFMVCEQDSKASLCLKKADSGPFTKEPNIIISAAVGVFNALYEIKHSHVAPCLFQAALTGSDRWQKAQILH